MPSQKLMKIVSQEEGWTDQEWIGLTARETKRLLQDAVDYEKFHGNRPQILLHAGGYLSHSYIETTITYAKRFIDDAFSRGTDCIERYEWIESGHMEGSVHIMNFGIVLNVRANTESTEEHKAKHAALDAARDEIFHEEE